MQCSSIFYSKQADRQQRSKAARRDQISAQPLAATSSPAYNPTLQGTLLQSGPEHDKLKQTPADEFGRAALPYTKRV